MPDDDVAVGAPLDRRGARHAARRVPRHHDLEDPVPREPGPDRPRAHAVGLPEVLRPGHRPAALDPAPAEGELPAAQGDQGSPRGRRTRSSCPDRRAVAAATELAPRSRRATKPARRPKQDDAEGARADEGRADDRRRRADAPRRGEARGRRSRRPKPRDPASRGRGRADSWRSTTARRRRSSRSTARATPDPCRARGGRAGSPTRRSTELEEFGLLEPAGDRRRP